MSTSKSQITIATFDCTLSDLTLFSTASTRAETVFAQTEPLAVRVTVDFLGSGSIALLALAINLQVEFFAKAIGEKNFSMGQVLLETNPKQLSYQPTLVLPEGLASVGFLPEKVHQLSALLRVGNPNYPAMVTGFIEGLLIQTYNQQ
jgi:hypothetical protein